jgi:hypothetical protein
MAKQFTPVGYDTTLYRKSVQNKDSYGNDKTIFKNDSPTRIDDTDESNIYLGWAQYGTSENEPLWKIKKIENNSGVWAQKYADGNEFYDNVWANRINLNYK